MEQINLFDYQKEKFKINKPIRLIELFGGIGSQAMALRNIGADFEHYRLVEFDKYAVNSYNAIHGTDFKPMDITQTTGKDLEIVDSDKYTYLMSYSFPCQDLSVAGEQKGMEKGSGTRSGLIWEVERLLNECDELPQVLLMENVTEVHSKDNVKSFAKWIEFLESKGYSNYFKDMNAKNYGMPQSRKRCFMVSIRGGYKYEFPRKQKLKLSFKDMLENEVDDKYFLSETMLKCFTDMKDRNGFIRGLRFKPHDIETSKYAYTITTMSGSRATDNYIKVPFETENGIEYKIRKLTPKEAWRFMGFSDDDFGKARKIQSDTRMYKQAGNSIVVNVLEEIFKQML